MKNKKQNRIVKKSNALIRSHWRIDSVWEPRLVSLIASKILPEDKDFKTYQITVSELLAGTNQRRGGRFYDEIKTILKKIVGRVIEIHDNINPLKTNYYSLFSKCSIDESSGLIEVRFDPDLKVHFLELKARFTIYRLEEFMQLQSSYSQRLFEILMSWKNLPDGEVTIEMEELHEQLDTPPTQRKNFKEFRERVLEKAQKDILSNPNSSLYFEWEAIKEGRKVVAVRFILDPQKAEQIRRMRETEERRNQQKRNNILYLEARKCYGNLDREDIPSENVCEVCQKLFLPLRDCQLLKKVTVNDSKM